MTARRSRLVDLVKLEQSKTNNTRTSILKPASSRADSVVLELDSSAMLDIVPGNCHSGTRTPRFPPALTHAIADVGGVLSEAPIAALDVHSNNGTLAG